MAQQELQTLLNLPDQEKLRLAHRLLESLVAKTNGWPAAPEFQNGAAQPAESPTELEDAPSPSAQAWLSMAGMYSGGPPDTGERADEICAAEICAPQEKFPFLSLAGIFSGGSGDTGERADEICAAEIKRRSGFTLKEELPE